MNKEELTTEEEIRFRNNFIRDLVESSDSINIEELEDHIEKLEKLQDTPISEEEE